MNLALLSTAAGLGVFHTAIGVDHYLPFAAMSKANKWSFSRTMFIVFICGVGHVLGSVILGFIGIFFGISLTSLAGIEEFRGEAVTWFLIAFGLIYMIIGIKNAVKNKPHRHITAAGGEVWHNHKDDTHNEPADVHIKKTKTEKSFWPLFILLVLGPCEPLIPLLMYPAASGGLASVVITAAVFCAATILTMIVCTAVVLKGFDMLPVKRIERYAHALAGFAVFACGVAIILFDI